jgi:hypothetical protein
MTSPPSVIRKERVSAAIAAPRSFIALSPEEVRREFVEASAANRASKLKAWLKRRDRNLARAKQRAEELEDRVQSGVFPTEDELEKQRRINDSMAQYRAEKSAVALRISAGFEWQGGRIGSTRIPQPIHDPRRGPKRKLVKLDPGFNGLTSPTPEDQRIGGYEVAPFLEQGLRSGESGFHMRFAQYTDKGSIRGSIDKDVLYTVDRKIFGLDLPYITLRPDWLCTHRIDLDTTWPTQDALVAVLQAKVDAGQLPCLPHGYASARLPDGDDRIVRPHLFWHLPKEQEVRTTSYGDSPAERLFYSVQVGIVKALEDIGADIGAVANPRRIKNPLSPLWRSACIQDEVYPSLQQWRNFVCTATTRNQALVAKITEISGLDETTSNFLYIRAGIEARAFLLALHDAKDPTYLSALGNCDAMSGIVSRHIMSGLKGMDPDHTRIWKIAQLCGKRYGGGWDPARARTTGNRGAYAAEMISLTDTAERRAASGRITGSVRVSKSIQAISDAVTSIVNDTGELPSQAEVSRRTGISKNTVCAHWKTAISASQIGAVKKLRSSETEDHNPSLPSPTSSDDSAASASCRIAVSVSAADIVVRRRPDCIADAANDLSPTNCSNRGNGIAASVTDSSPIRENPAARSPCAILEADTVVQVARRIVGEGARTARGRVFTSSVDRQPRKQETTATRPSPSVLGRLVSTNTAAPTPYAGDPRRLSRYVDEIDNRPEWMKRRSPSSVLPKHAWDARGQGKSVSVDQSSENQENPAQRRPNSVLASLRSQGLDLVCDTGAPEVVVPRLSKRDIGIAKWRAKKDAERLAARAAERERKEAVRKAVREAVVDPKAAAQQAEYDRQMALTRAARGEVVATVFDDPDPFDLLTPEQQAWLDAGPTETDPEVIRRIEEEIPF